MGNKNTQQALDDLFGDPFKLKRFKQLMNETNQCMATRQRTGFPRDTDKCENVELGMLNLWSFHTHPHGKPTPSGMDIKTTKQMGHKVMCIGLAPTGEIVCYDTTGKKVVARKHV